MRGAGLTLTIGVKSYGFSWNPTAGTTHYQLFEDPDGLGPLAWTQIGGDIPVATTAATHAVAVHRRLNAQYTLRACNGTSCGMTTAAVVPDLTRAIGYFKSSNPDLGDAFGASVALSADGGTLAIGAPFEDSSASGINGNQADNSTGNAGAVYVFTRSGGVWSQQAYIKASNPGATDAFGTSIALSADGNTLAVGAIQEDSGATGINGNQADNGTADSGAVYVFTRAGGAWSQQAYVKAGNPQVGAQLGIGVALSADGNTLAASAWGERSGATGINGNQADTSAPNSGAAYVFTRAGGVWSQQAYVKAGNTEAGDLFGIAIALSGDGDTLAVGARLEAGGVAGINGNQADNTVPGSGAVYVYTRAGATWSQQAYVKASNPGTNDEFGASVALSADGSTLAVGAAQEDSNATGINGNQADNSAGGSGAAYVFTRAGGAWSQQAYVKAGITEAVDLFGNRVALSADGNTLAVGAVGEDSSATGIGGNQADNTVAISGAAYVFTRAGAAWSQQSYVKASTLSANDQLGRSIALSGDGNTLAVGATGEDSGSTGVQGDQANDAVAEAGAVFVY
ncbi:MAG: integrin [Comamonadaceae bacterium]|nr:MAG: integrin [Comamonadaceae bacterium]